MSQSKAPTNAYTLTFVVILCFTCSFVLSVLASALKAPQEQAELIERSSQTLRSAQIFNPKGYFQIRDEEGNFVPAKHVGDGILAPGDTSDIADPESILAVYSRRIHGFLVDAEGKRLSFEEAGLNESDYVAANWKSGYANVPLRLVYEIRPNSKEEGDPVGYIFPVAGYGLWDAIVGYVAMETDGMHVIGIAWYWHKETPGLGAEISESAWQSNFPGKMVFQIESGQEKPNLAKAPIGITVVRGSVADVYGDTAKARSAVDGMAGATLTGSGVTKAYKDSLEAYRPFLIKLNEKNS